MKKYLKVMMACVFCTLVLSSCNTSSSSNGAIITESESLIKEITADYLTEISSGMFADNIYKSNFTPNITLKDLTFKQPQAQSLMNESMTHMTFEILNIKKVENFFSDLFDKRVKANCLVKVSTIDIEIMLKKINDPSLGYPELIKLLQNKDQSSFMQKTIALTLAYDDKLMKWEIINNSQLIDLTITPYRELTLSNPAGSPDPFAAEYIQGVLALDTKKIFELTMQSDNINVQIEGNMEDARFFKDNNINLEEAKKLFSYIEIEAEPSSELSVEDPPENYLAQANVPLRVYFPDIADDLRALGHPASLDEIINLLEKSDTSHRALLMETDLYLATKKDSETWHITSTRVFYTIVRSVWNSIYDYPYMPTPAEISELCMNQLTSGIISNALEFQLDEASVSLYNSSIRLLQPTEKNRLFIQELLEGYSYKFISIEENQNQPDAYLARYSISLPDLILLRNQILSDKEALVPLLKSLIEIELAKKQTAFGDRAALYNAYVRYVKHVVETSNLPLQKYEFEMRLYRSFVDSDAHWVIDDIFIVKPDQDVSLIEFFGSDIANAAVESIIAEGVYSKEDFKDLGSYSF